MKTRLRLLYTLLGLCTLLTTSLSQESPLEFEKEFLLRTHWQEYMPDVYAIDDSTLLMAGLNVKMASLSMNILIRWMNLDGDVLKELEILNIDNPNRHSFLLANFAVGSTIDQDYIYVSAITDDMECISGGTYPRPHRMIKVALIDGSIVLDTVLCFKDIRAYHDIHTSPSEDTLYFYGSTGYLNQNPHILLTTMTKDFSLIIHDTLRTENTHILPMEIDGDSRMVAGSHYRYDNPSDKMDIWFGKIQGDTIIQDHRLKYFKEHFLYKPLILDSDEKAFLGLTSLSTESSIYLLRDDSLSWNFYATYAQQLFDIDQFGDEYCALQITWRDYDQRRTKIVLNFLDNEGFIYGSEEYIVPWIWTPLGGIKINQYYFVFSYQQDEDAGTAVATGQIPIEDAQYNYTHVLKFRIRE